MKSKTLTDDNDRPKVMTQNPLGSTDLTKTNLHLGTQYDLISTRGSQEPVSFTW